MHPAYKLMFIAWAAVAAWVAFVIILNRKIHPKALFALFMVELWERFSYYGMRAILVLYMTSELAKGGFAFDDAKAYGIYGAYGALVYLTPILGGFFADKIMGFRNAIIWGALLMAAGQFTLFLNNQATFYIGLALLVIGNGFFKPNISSMIGRFYPEGDPRRDGAFTIFYMGINIGAFLTPLTCGAIGEIEGWQYGFLTAGIGMVLGFLIFLWAQRKGWYENHGLRPEEPAKPIVKGIGNTVLPYLTTILLVPVAWVLILKNDVVDVMLAVLAIGILGYLLFLAAKYDTVQKQRIWVIVLLLLFTTVFWTFFELAGSAMNLFTERNVNKTFLGMTFTTTFFQSVNPLFIMLFAPVFSWLWITLGKSGKEPAAPYKFAVGLSLLGLGFLVLTLGNTAAKAGLVPAFFLIMLYLLHTLGELTLSPVGLSLVTKLSPAKIVGMLMGIWFLSSSIAHQAGKHIARFTTVSEAKIISNPEFKKYVSDERLFKVLSSENFITQLKEMSTEKALTSEQTLTNLNEGLEKPVYAVATLQIREAVERANELSNELLRTRALEESKKTFLIYADNDDTRDYGIIPQEEASKLLESSISGLVISSLRNDSLNLGLGVFRNLGLFAIGCGVVLFLLGPMVSRWMHGIK
ncbi:peptide MFS transporter [Schleiferia thermophila]|uniref:peptide MFS transporter n=1 Tax=Schleiferia thermophila TaxID=884107 RepID=UPI0004E6DD58|nr:peptide MFS transporter [Schleiferia thermophila]KFD38580.1 peptide ABC transporter [Schleiferia thermophila str. Yellowstone]